MMNRQFKPALNFEGKVLSNYKYKIDTHNRLLKTIKLALPENLSDHALYCVISEKKISLYTDSAVWSSQLRFYHQIILRAVKNSKQGNFQLLQIKVIPKTAEQTQSKIVKLPSKENISFIFDEASNNQNDDVLKIALLRLAKTFKRLSD